MVMYTVFPYYFKFTVESCGSFEAFEPFESTQVIGQRRRQLAERRRLGLVGCCFEWFAWLGWFEYVRMILIHMHEICKYVKVPNILNIQNINYRNLIYNEIKLDCLKCFGLFERVRLFGTYLCIVGVFCITTCYS